MRAKLIGSVLVGSLLVSPWPMAAFSGAAFAGPSDKAPRYAKASKYVTYQRRQRVDHYAARAHDLDPAGDYKGYPNWARVALSPKFDGNRR